MCEARGATRMKNVIAVIWDCDKTLIDGYMQDPMFAEYGVETEAVLGG